MLYPFPTPERGEIMLKNKKQLRVTGLAGRLNGELLRTRRTKAMTTEIFYLTAQLQRWLNQQVARHLEAQAAKFSR
jgi:hypothetical protein